MNCATTLTTKSSGFATRGTHAASTSAPPRSTTMRGGRRRSSCSGRRCRAGAGGSIGRGRTVVSDLCVLDRHDVYFSCMSPLVYFDTDCFHHFAATFQNCALANDLRDKILFSPVTMMEVFSHLARNWGNKVHKQIQGLHNWVVPDHALVLPWMDAATSQIGFGVKPEDDGYTKRLQADLNACATSELPGLLDVAKGRDAELQQVKQTYAGHFQDTVQFFRTTPLTEDAFTKVWLNGLAQRSAVPPNTRPAAEVVAALSALHEFEFSKLKVAIHNKSYNAQKHRNDLFDAEQLIYLGDSVLHFLTLDGGYLTKIMKSPQRCRIHRVSESVLADAGKVEILLRQITS